MSAKEYNLWIAEYNIEPHGEDRSDIRAGTIVKSNLIPHSKKDIELKDCMINFEPPKKQTPAEMFEMLKGHTAAMGGKVK
jgi:hypothetical protein